MFKAESNKSNNVSLQEEIEVQFYILMEYINSAQYDTAQTLMSRLSAYVPHFSPKWVEHYSNAQDYLDAPANTADAG